MPGSASKVTGIDSHASYAIDKDDASLDGILVSIGQCGRFQVMVFLLICVPMLFHAIFSVTYVFTASHVDHRCNITECDTPSSRYSEPWTEFSIPKKGNGLDQCSQYTSKVNYSRPEYDDKNVCSADNFHNNQITKCDYDNFIFRGKEVTISNEFGIFCDDEWKLSLVGTMNNIGQFVGIPIGGFISDRYGRRTLLAFGGFVVAVLGVIRSFSPNYIFFVCLEFLDNLAGGTLYSTCFIIGIELVSPNKRVIACSVITICYALGEITLALVAKYYQNWRWILRIVYTPALILITYFWVLPESVRWLLSQGKEEEAKEVLKRAATINKRQVSDAALDKLVCANRDKLLAVTEGKFPIKEAFTKLFWRIANCSFCWIVNVLVYYGISLNAVLLDGNKYNNFIFIALVEIPGFFLPYFTMDRIGRRYSLFTFMMISGSCCLGTIFVPRDHFSLNLILFLIGKGTITASFQVLYFFTSEIFPTNLRNSLLSFCSMVGRVGSMVAPQTPLLAKYSANAPAILFAATAILSGSLSLFFPETTNLVLPTTMKEADDIGIRKKPPQNGEVALS